MVLQPIMLQYTVWKLWCADMKRGLSFLIIEFREGVVLKRKCRRLRWPVTDRWVIFYRLWSWMCEQVLKNSTKEYFSLVILIYLRDIQRPKGVKTSNFSPKNWRRERREAKILCEVKETSACCCSINNGKLVMCCLACWFGCSPTQSTVGAAAEAVRHSSRRQLRLF